MATIVGNRSIKRLAEDEKRGSNKAFSGHLKVGPCLVRSDRLKPQQGDSLYDCDSFQADRHRDG
jgi:hypothetical protein